MFGNNNQSSGGGFSFGGATNAPKPAFSFGNTGSTTASTASTTTAAPAAPAPAPTGGFSFGSKPAGAAPSTAAPTGGFSFGAKPATQTPAPATGGFGATATTTGAPSSTGGFSFGSKPAGTTASGTSTTPSLFGNNSTAIGTTTGTSTGTSLFGAKPAGTMSLSTGTSLFGGNQQQQQQQQLQQPQQPVAINSQPSFAWSKPSDSLTGNTMQTTQGTFNSQQQAQNVTNVTTSNQNPQDYTPTINDKLEKIKSSWDPTNPQCKMVTHLYNKVDATFNNFTRPANESPEEWEEAMRNRPKEYNSIPVKCSGFSELYERNQLQDNHVKQTRILLNEMDGKLRRLNEKHDLHSNTLLMKCKIKQRDLNIKLLRIAINLSILKYKGYPLTNDEELLIEKFKSLLAKLDDPVGLNRVNELWARLSSLKEKYMDINGVNQLSIDSGATTAEEAESSDVMKKLVKVLAKQQQGIQLLCELMEEDEAKLARLAE